MSLYLGKEKINNINSQVASQGGGSVSLSDDLPLVDGTASAGVSLLASRADHVHPNDDTKLNTSGGTMTGPIWWGANGDGVRMLDFFTLSTSPKLLYGRSILKGYLGNDTSSAFGTNAANGVAIIFNNSKDIPLVIHTKTGDFKTGTVLFNNSNISMDGNFIHELAAPTEDTDAANKKYVDDLKDTYIFTESVCPTFDELTTILNKYKAFFFIDNYGKVYNLIYKGIATTQYQLMFTYAGLNGNVNITDGARIYVSRYIYDIIKDQTRPSTWSSERYEAPSVNTKIDGVSLYGNVKFITPITITFPSSGWTTSGDYITQGISDVNIEGTYRISPMIDVALDQLTTVDNKVAVAKAWAKISPYIEAEAGGKKLTLSIPASIGAPTVDIPIRLTAIQMTASYDR